MRRTRPRSRIYRQAFSDRTATLTIREEPDHTICKLRLTKYGEPFPDRRLFDAWLRPIYQRYDGDGKPFIHDCPTGERVAVFDDGTVLVKPAEVEKAPLNYVPKVLELARSQGLSPGVYHTTVMHDDDCPMLRGEARCNCDPIVRPGMPDGADLH